MDSQGSSSHTAEGAWLSGDELLKAKAMSDTPPTTSQAAVGMGPPLPWSVSAGSAPSLSHPSSSRVPGATPDPPSSPGLIKGVQCLSQRARGKHTRTQEL